MSVYGAVPPFIHRPRSLELEVPLSRYPCPLILSSVTKETCSKYQAADNEFGEYEFVFGRTVVPTKKMEN